jgi:hypothetical protein
MCPADSCAVARSEPWVLDFGGYGLATGVSLFLMVLAQRMHTDALLFGVAGGCVILGGRRSRQRQRLDRKPNYGFSGNRGAVRLPSRELPSR